ncbi:DeoR/GlpR family DNA-binding transcription regulator [Alsobacter sp. KACC 23698]|uniref:DeoR/GlpR family DNA-binding transcription regulator n=1 Tax=Alsobacter sp. KACC 23698 TaxID=3149229 RepID=A0AAU7J9M3_9HYPH
MQTLSPRQSEIIGLARMQGRVSVDDLALRYEVSPQTIRKDLNELCDQRILSRVHGGAVVASSVENLAYEARRFIARDEKAAIGRAAASLIPNNASLFINIGTTTEEVARCLKDHAGLLVITNNLHVATLLYPHPKIEVIVAGGPVRRSDGGVVGAAAIDLIRQFKVDYAVVGTSAIDPEGVLLDYDYREVRVSRAIMENARKTLLVADSLKFERSAPVRIGHLGDVDMFVTDRVPVEPIRELCRRESIEVIETGPPSPGHGAAVVD